jgi:hypothetical protein
MAGQRGCAYFITFSANQGVENVIKRNSIQIK